MSKSSTNITRNRKTENNPDLHKTQEFLRLELDGMDGDILLAAAAAKIGCDWMRLQLLQIRRDVSRIANALENLK